MRLRIPAPTIWSKKPDGLAFDSTLAVVSGCGADEHAVRFAARLTKPRSGRLHIAHVIEVDRGRAVDSDDADESAAADDLLDAMERAARPYRRQVTCALLQARRAGYAIVQEAADRNVDAVVMGIPYKTRHGRFTLGEAVPYVLEHAPCDVYLRRGAGTESLNSGAPPESVRAEGKQ